VPATTGGRANFITRRAYGAGTIAKAISDGAVLHAQEHAQDAGGSADGVVANQCLMATMGFAEGYYIRALELPVGLLSL
jgi:hypothetical protein